MTPFSQNSLERQLAVNAKRLVQYPPSRDRLLPLLDQIGALLSKVDQSSEESMQNALSPLKAALAKEDLLKHSDVDVNVGVASCISQITRITAPNIPYDHDRMKDVFQLIVSSFENLSDISSRSYENRATILEIVTKAKASLLMMDLECDQMIIEMFQHFLKAIRKDHPDIIFTCMEKIMTLVLEESWDISPELLAPILATLKRNDEAAMPITKKLAECVLQNSANKLRPYLRQVVKSLNTSLDDYSEVVSRVCGENTDTGGHSSESILIDQPAGKDGSEKINFQDENPTAAGSPKSVVSSGSIKETVTKEIKVLDNHKIPERTWASNVVVNIQLSDEEQEQRPTIQVEDKSDQVAAASESNDEVNVSVDIVYDAPSSAKILPSAVDKGKRVADAPLVKDLSKRHKSLKSKTPDLPLDKGKSKKNVARHSPNDFFTLELPKNFPDINEEESSKFVRFLHTPDDSLTFNLLNPGPISEVVSQRFAQFASALGHMMQTVENSANLPDLRPELATKEQELASATQQVVELTKALEDQKKAFEEQKKIDERSQQELIEHFLSREEDLKKKAFDDGLVKGINLYRGRLFQTCAGQVFLKDLHEGLLSAYRKSTLYLEDMGPYIGQFVSHGFKFALKQARTMGFKGKLDATHLISTLNLSPAFEGDEKLPPTHPWWLPVMNSAIKRLISNDIHIVDPELFPSEEVFYHLDLPESSSGHRG